MFEPVWGPLGLTCDPLGVGEGPLAQNGGLGEPRGGAWGGAWPPKGVPRLISGKQSSVFRRNPFKRIVLDMLLAKSGHTLPRFLLFLCTLFPVCRSARDAAEPARPGSDRGADLM